MTGKIIIEASQNLKDQSYCMALIHERLIIDHDRVSLFSGTILWSIFPILCALFIPFCVLLVEMGLGVPKGVKIL